MAKAGLPKLNLATKSISIKSSASSSLSGAQRCGISYGIMAQRSNTSIFSPKLAYSNSTSAMRHELNRKVVINNNMPPIKAQQDNGMSTMEKLMMFASMGSMATQLGKGIADTITELKGSKADTSNNNSNVEGKGDTGTLNDLSKENTKIGKEVADFNAGYKTLADGNITKLNDIAHKAEYKNSENEFINSNSKKLFNTEALKTQDLGVSADTSIPDLKTAAGTIDKDIQEVEEYLTNLPTIANIEAENGTLTKGIAELQTQISQLNPNDQNYANQKADLEAQKQKLEKQQKELEKFKSDVIKANSLANKILEDIQAQKAEFSKLIQKKEENADKMFKQAQADDKAIGENNKKMEALDTKIKAEKDDTKKQKLIAQYNKLATLNKTLNDSLTTAMSAGDILSSAGAKFKKTAEAMVNPYPTDGITGGAVNDVASRQIQKHSFGDSSQGESQEPLISTVNTKDLIHTTNFNVSDQGESFLYNMDPNNLRNGHLYS